MTTYMIGLQLDICTDAQYDRMIAKLKASCSATLRYIDFGGALPNIIGGIAMIAISFVRLNISISIMKILGFIVFNFSSIILTYSILLLP
jgi:hypothetical protein